MGIPIMELYSMTLGDLEARIEAHRRQREFELHNSRIIAFYAANSQFMKGPTKKLSDILVLSSDNTKPMSDEEMLAVYKKYSEGVKKLNNGNHRRRDKN